MDVVGNILDNNERLKIIANIWIFFVRLLQQDWKTIGKSLGRDWTGFQAIATYRSILNNYGKKTAK